MGYLIPAPLDLDYSVDLPEHPCLSFERGCHQQLSVRHGRHLVVMRKTKEYQEADRLAYDAYRRRVLEEAAAVTAAMAETDALQKNEPGGSKTGTAAEKEEEDDEDDEEDVGEDDASWARTFNGLPSGMGDDASPFCFTTHSPAFFF